MFAIYKRFSLPSVFVVFFFFAECFGLDNGLGRTPAMGWSSWNKFACEIDEDIIKKTADALVSTGLRDAGYKYLNLDDCWQSSRMWNGRIVPDKRFPSGIKALSDYIHERGLKVGLYSSAGYWTCQKRPGSLWREETDANSYAEWEIDYLKYDNCHNFGIDPVKRYTWMRDALNETNRPILYSVCNWGERDPWIWGPSIANSWRVTGDINDFYRSNKTQDSRHCDPCGMLEILDSTVGLEQYSAPGGFNDLDMLEVGNGGMTDEEYKTHFSFWAALKSPLIIGCDVHNISKKTLEILTNTEIIAVNQDPLGESARLVYREEESYDIWMGKLTDNEAKEKQIVVILFNRAETKQKITLPFSLLPSFNHNKVVLKIRDLWLGKNLGVFKNKFFTSDDIPSHGVVVLKITYTLIREFWKFRVNVIT